MPPTAASAEAAKYVPDQLKDVQARCGAQGLFRQQDFAAVVTKGPGVLSAAESLATAAAAKKDEVLKALNEQLDALAAALPEEVAAVQARIDLLGKKPAKNWRQASMWRPPKPSSREPLPSGPRPKRRSPRAIWTRRSPRRKSVKAQLDAAAEKLKVALPAAK